MTALTALYSRPPKEVTDAEDDAAGSGSDAGLRFSDNIHRRWWIATNQRAPERLRRDTRCSLDSGQRPLPGTHQQGRERDRVAIVIRRSGRGCHPVAHPFWGARTEWR